jgi:2-polyprenyl-3-methyl-5-hydroxy-6-metoxy-1,4-benzoquinol methylase
VTHPPHDKPDSYDNAYRQHGALFGAEPSTWLLRHEALLPSGCTVLDLGCGQGRNSLYLAGRGHSMHALDPSSVAIATLQEAAARQDLPVKPMVGGFEAHQAPPGGYGAVLLFGIVQVLARPQIVQLHERIRTWLAPGGLLFVTAFTTLDPCIGPGIAGATPIGRNSYRRPDGSVRTWLVPGELPTLFEDLEPKVFEEGLGPWHHHGDGPKEQHHVASAVLEVP